MFNIEKFHNQLALSLGYERIVQNKGISILVEESADPYATLKILGYEDFKFQASDNSDNIKLKAFPDVHNEIKEIVDAVHQAYLSANKSFF